jgi:simple sugar transport system ATP-binding protein
MSAALLSAASDHQARAPMARVRLTGICKSFGDFLANDHVDLDLHDGEIHALLGENGAGKSTLVKIIYGLLEPNAGSVSWQGELVRLTSPQQARALGIGMVFQHFSLFDALSVSENVALALPEGIGLDQVAARIKEVSERYDIALDPDRPVWTLSAGERQRIEIARCLLQDPKLLILDEPTSVLTPQEADSLFATLLRLKQEGRAILYISHKLDEVQRLCDRATIMRQGRVVARCNPKAETARSLAALMVGAQVDDIKSTASQHNGRLRLTIDHLTLPQPEHGIALHDISLQVRAGEILGIAGIAGNGQAELFAALSGETLSATPDSIRLDDVPVGQMDITQRRRLSAAFVPEERNGHAAAPEFLLSENAILSGHADGQLTRWMLLDFAGARQLARKVMARFDVRSAATDPLAGSLSGGNLQKFVLGREILRKPKVLIIMQPTWGVDASAAMAIRQALIDLASSGASLVLISQDLDELLDLADRIAVLHAGRLSPATARDELTRDDIGLLMMGLKPGDHHAA